MEKDYVKRNLYVKKIDSEGFSASLRHDGIIHVDFHDNTTIDPELQEKLNETYHLLTNVKRPFVFTGGEFVTITTEARDNTIKMEHRNPSKASAVVVINLAQKIIANYFVKVNKPSKPYKVFNSFDKAVEWLLENHPAEEK